MKTTMKSRHQLLSLLACMLSAPVALAQVPETISYQGRVTVSSTNFTGTGQFKFALVSPGVNASRQATATATVTSGFITAINVTDSGAGYTTAPGVTIADPTGSGAAVTAHVTDGVVTSITVNAGGNGSGYSASSTVTVDAPPPNLVSDTYWSNDDTSSQGSEPTAAVPVPVNGGLVTVFLGNTNLTNMINLPAKTFNNADMRLRIWFSDGINPFACLTPDQPLGAAGYAMMAARVAEGSVGETELAPGTVTTDKLSRNAVSTAILADNSVTTEKIANGTIVDADVSTSAALRDTKLATIATAGKVANSATTATSSNTANAIVARDTYGSFSARTITATDVFAGSGADLTELNASQLRTGTVPDARLAGNVARTNQVWLLNGNAGITGGSHFLGTTDNQPLELKVNGQRGLRLELGGSNSVNVIGGYLGNSVATGVAGSTVAGGGVGNYSGYTWPNRVEADFGTVSGGRANTIQTNAFGATIGGGGFNTIHGNYATIGGGDNNTIQIGASHATIGGGSGNTIQSNATHAIIGGGGGNEIQNHAQHSTISGGGGNTIEANATLAIIGGGLLNTIYSGASQSVIGGGAYNWILTDADYGTIPGGRDNVATSYAFAAGCRAEALHTGAFVWGDSTDENISSTNANSVTMRASGGYRLFSNSGLTVGAFLAAGSGSWTSMSDRNVKEEFQPINPQAVLAKVAALPLSTWKYKSQDASVRHIGPMAQDFKAAFAVGETDTGITSIDADGVALAAIQGLNQKIEEQRAALSAKEQTILALEIRLIELEKLVQNLRSTAPGN